LYPIATGFHAPIDEAEQLRPRKLTVYSNDSRVLSTVINLAGQSAQITLVDPSTLPVTSDPAAFLSNAKAAGIDRVIFAEASVESSVQGGSVAVANAYYAGSRSFHGTVYGLTVSVRSMDTATGSIRWSGSARYNAAIPNPDTGLVKLTTAAIARATCRLEAGYQWVDELGCTPPPTNTNTR
jgi:hypothetical protein